jgi:hypothetical protein
MSKTSQSIAVISTEISRLPSRFRVASREAHRLQRRALRMARRRPARSLLGAFAIGIAVARLARLVSA